MIPYNIQPGTLVRNIKTKRETTYNSRVSINGNAPAAHLSGLRWMRWENFSKNYEIAGNPSLMTSIG